MLKVALALQPQQFMITMVNMGRHRPKDHSLRNPRCANHTCLDRPHDNLFKVFLVLQQLDFSALTLLALFSLPHLHPKVLIVLVLHKVNNMHSHSHLLRKTRHRSTVGTGRLHNLDYNDRLPCQHPTLNTLIILALLVMLLSSHQDSHLLPAMHRFSRRDTLLLQRMLRLHHLAPQREVMGSTSMGSLKLYLRHIKSTTNYIGRQKQRLRGTAKSRLAQGQDSNQAD